jgi:hypothetical protein
MNLHAIGKYFSMPTNQFDYENGKNNLDQKEFDVQKTLHCKSPENKHSVLKIQKFSHSKDHADTVESNIVPLNEWVWTVLLRWWYNKTKLFFKVQPINLVCQNDQSIVHVNKDIHE